MPKKTGTDVIVRDEKCSICGHVFEESTRKEIDAHVAVEPDEPLAKAFVYAYRESQIIPKKGKPKGVVYGVIVNDGELVSGLSRIDERERYPQHTHVHKGLKMRLDYPSSIPFTVNSANINTQIRNGRIRVLGRKEFKIADSTLTPRLREYGIENLVRSPIPGFEEPLGDIDTREYEAVVRDSIPPQ